MKFFIATFLVFGLLGCSESSTVNVPLELPPVVIESETGCLNLKREPVPCEDIMPIPNPPTIPEPYKTWGWTIQEYDSLLLCKNLGGKMGSSKNCRMPDIDG